MMNFVIIGEAVSKLTDEVKLKNQNIPWNKVKGFRNLVAHDYFGIDAEEVWQIIQDQVPALINQLKKINRKIKK